MRSQASADVTQGAFMKGNLSLGPKKFKAPLPTVGKGTLTEATIQQIGSVHIDIRQPTSRLERLPGFAGTAVLTITDNGPGLLGNALKNVFEAFWRDKDCRGGSGLRLTVIRAIVHVHDGQVRPDNAPGHGACTVGLPARTYVQAPSSSAEQKLGRQAESPSVTRAQTRNALSIRKPVSQLRADSTKREII